MEPECGVEEQIPFTPSEQRGVDLLDILKGADHDQPDNINLRLPGGSRI